jgi:hypothetical protein
MTKKPQQSDHDHARYTLDRTRLPVRGGAWFEQDKFGCWSVVRAIDGARLMCGLSCRSYAADWARSMGYLPEASDAEVLHTLEAWGKMEACSGERVATTG